MFSISFTDSPPDYPYDDLSITAQSGLLVLGNTLEGFSANLGTWDRATYEEHWLSQLSLVATGRRKVALIVSFTPPELSSNLEIWALFRDGERVYLQNHLPWYSNFPANFQVSLINDYLQEREVLTHEGQQISEWETSVRDIQLFLRRAERPLVSHIP